MTGENILITNQEKSDVRTLAKTGKERLEAAGIDDAAYDARQLLLACTGMTETSFLANPQKIPANEQIKKYDFYLSQREKRIPLQHILGSTWFYGREFLVNENVLIPRPDTEILVEHALNRISDGGSVLDVCTGSGCILLTLCCEKKLQEAVGTDLSFKALEMAERNARHLAGELMTEKIRFLQGDLCAPVKGEKFDVIVSNPPYIKSCVIPSLEPEVRDHDPKMALDGGEDGLIFYRKITRQTKELLAPGGALLFEIGYDQADAVRSILLSAGFGGISVYKDYGGNDRVIEGFYGRS